jgi:hypothetical protein
MEDTVAQIRKALVAGAIAGLTALAPLLTDTAHVDRAAILAVVAAVVGGVITYLAPNKPAA